MTAQLAKHGTGGGDGGGVPASHVAWPVTVVTVGAEVTTAFYEPGAAAAHSMAGQGAAAPSGNSGGAAAAAPMQSAPVTRLLQGCWVFVTGPPRAMPPDFKQMRCLVDAESDERQAAEAARAGGGRSPTSSEQDSWLEELAWRLLLTLDTPNAAAVAQQAGVLLNKDAMARVQQAAWPGLHQALELLWINPKHPEKRPKHTTSDAWRKLMLGERG